VGGTETWSEDFVKGKTDSLKRTSREIYRYENIYNLYALNYIQGKHIEENVIVTYEYYKDKD
jgi:hypothetical protein